MNNYEKISLMTEKEFVGFLSDVMNCKYCPARDKCTNEFCSVAIEQWLEEQTEE